MDINTFKSKPPSTQSIVVPRSIWQNPLHFIAFGFGSGALPYAPGTWGTLMAIPFYLAIQTLPIVIYLIITLLVILSSIWLCNKISQEIKVHDHPGMCLDEIVGFLVTMTAAPTSIYWIMTGFLLFRLFDIWKPQPIRCIDEKVGGGLGIILDDVVAGIFACIVLHIVAWIL
jgi:phosphatidylglycerophosphatase A